MRRPTLPPLDLSAYGEPDFDLQAVKQQLGRTLGLKRAEERRLEKDRANPYANSFRLFLKDCVRTTDKAMAGLVREWPVGPDWDDYWEDWETALLTASPLLIDKTRRTMASNVICAFDLWLASGGTDPRWPVLLKSRDNRSVIIQAQKKGANKEDEGCSAEFVSRIEALYLEAEKAGIRTLWPSFPKWEFGFGWARASNGGKILAVPEGPGQVRGPGTTLLHMEEGGEWEQAEATCSVALPSLFPHGHVVMVTTPVVGSYVQRIRNGEIKTGAGEAIPAPPPMKKLPLTVQGDWYVLEIRGKRDIPGYDPVQVGRGMPPQTYRREVLGDWSASSGKVVYEEYGEIHAPLQQLPFDYTRQLVCGWDLPAATGGTPAFIASQISGAGQWCIYGSLLPGHEESLGVYEFAERVAEWLYETFAKPANLRLEDLKLVHYGDPAGAQKGLAGGKSTEIRSAYEIIRNGDKIEIGLDPVTRQPLYKERRGFGWIIQPGEVSSIKRVECVRQRLCANVRGAPAMVFAPSATFLKEAFAGGYHYKQRSDGRYELDPDKNRYSHCLSGDTLIETRRGQVPIREVTTSDEVMTRKGWRCVLKSWQSGVSPVVRVEFSDGRSLLATDEHLVWADGSWVQARSLRYNAVCNARPFNSKEQTSIGIRGQRDGLSGCISTATLEIENYATTWPFGKVFTVQSLTDGTFIIGTETHLTTISKIWSASLRKIIGRRIRNEGLTRQRRSGRIWIGLDHWLHSGMDQRKDAPFIVRTGWNKRRVENLASLCVKSVARLFSPQWLTTKSGIAGVTVVNGPETNGAMTRKSVFARDAERLSDAIAMPEQSFVPLRVAGVTTGLYARPVYDLTVEDEHEFYANGVLVHNCVEALQYAASKLFLQHPENDPVADAIRAQRQFAPATRTVGRGR